MLLGVMAEEDWFERSEREVGGGSFVVAEQGSEIGREREGSF